MSLLQSLCLYYNLYVLTSISNSLLQYCCVIEISMSLSTISMRLMIDKISNYTLNSWALVSINYSDTTIAMIAIYDFRVVLGLNICLQVKSRVLNSGYRGLSVRLATEVTPRFKPM